MVKTLESSFSPKYSPFYNSLSFSFTTPNGSLLLNLLQQEPPFSRTSTVATGDELHVIKSLKKTTKQMGKYMGRGRNSKTSGDVSLIDIPSNAGVRTRAKTLALRSAAVSATGGSYIQLRSRRLVKPTVPKRHKENRVPPKSNKGAYKGANSSGVKVDCVNSSGSVEKLGKEEIHHEGAIRDDEDVGVDDEGSFGENMVEIEGRGRSTRETTPCDLIRDPDTISTPGSSTKRAYSNNANYRVQTSAPSHIPLTAEMDEFFTEPEKQQQQLFIEKYNFDPVNDKPLPGRYEWVKMDDSKNVN